MSRTAWPEIDDQRDGLLFAGSAGTLLDAMLRAIGTTQDDCYRASLAVTRPPGGRCELNAAEELARLLRHHLKLARPERLMLIGDDILRSEEQTSELQSLMRISYAVFRLPKKNKLITFNQ